MDDLGGSRRTSRPALRHPAQKSHGALGHRSLVQRESGRAHLHVSPSAKQREKKIVEPAMIRVLNLCLLPWTYFYCHMIGPLIGTKAIKSGLVFRKGPIEK